MNKSKLKANYTFVDGGEYFVFQEYTIQCVKNLLNQDSANLILKYLILQHLQGKTQILPCLSLIGHMAQ